MAGLDQAWVVSAGGALILAAGFALAVSAHLGDPERLRRVLGSLGLPAAFAPLPAGFEAALAVLLAAAPRLGGRLAAGYLVTLTLVFCLAWKIRGAIPDCGCGPRPAPVDLRFFLRNLLLIALAAAAAVAAPLGWAGTAAPIAGAVFTGIAILFHRRSAASRLAGSRRTGLRRVLRRSAEPAGPAPHAHRLVMAVADRRASEP